MSPFPVFEFKKRNSTFQKPEKCNTAYQNDTAMRGRDRFEVGYDAFHADKIRNFQ